MRRDTPSIKPKVCSATDTALSPGMFITSTPAEVAMPFPPLNRSHGV